MKFNDVYKKFLMEMDCSIDCDEGDECYWGEDASKFFNMLKEFKNESSIKLKNEYNNARDFVTDLKLFISKVQKTFPEKYDKYVKDDNWLPNTYDIMVSLEKGTMSIADAIKEL